ncbi:sugar ABC transporter ATP-binding protein [Lacisediminihabitans changchengi]|uniref:Sugar ABC transporter ATP-binding protein n=1 Tax=Lacisediminihabitans changchengi TaxID=2787634 RepID=A0A934SI68_9MICO|nr:sugar ABC transporter ATP-binding protein [Lacisediminihabitans changchengi]MBK4347122.1 sugar ABC transporter ATP-binding protein [Lacisediminihabitans changchengi]
MSLQQAQPEASTDAVTFSARDISKSFGPIVALDAVTLELRSGEITALMGENGAGKSTLLKILTGDYVPDSGTLTLDGVEVHFTDPAHAHAAGLRVISQEPEIVPHVSVAENIYVGSLGVQGFFFDRRKLQARAAADLSRYGFDQVISPTTIGSQLSAAQRQIVEIMRAVIDNPRVICFDEPTSSLGDDEVTLLFRLIRQLRAEGKAIGYVSHRMNEIFQLADRITVLRDGKLVGTKKTQDTDHNELVHMMVGRDLSQMFQRERQPAGATVLHLQNVTTDDVHDITMTVKAGEVVGVAGLVGAGRSELMKAIVGDLPIRGGEVFVNGERAHFRSPADALAAGIGFAPEERKAEALIMQRTVRDNIVLASLSRIAKGWFISSRAEKAVATKYIGQLRIRTPSSEQLVKNLSGGNQQKVVLARWLALGPTLLVLDEPTRGVDVGAKAEIYAIIDQLAQQGVAILVVSSELPEVLGLADRIYVMAGGRIAGSVDRAEATEESILALAMSDTSTQHVPSRSADAS